MFFPMQLFINDDIYELRRVAENLGFEYVILLWVFQFCKRMQLV